MHRKGGDRRKVGVCVVDSMNTCTKKKTRILCTLNFFKNL